MKKIFTLLFLLYFGVCIAKKENNLPEGFVYVSSYVPDAVYDIRYLSNYNFVGKPIDGYLAPHPSLTIQAAEALVKAVEILRKQGFRVVIYDTYRPQKAVDHFVRWINDSTDKGDTTFYPRLKKSDLIAGDYITPKSGHSRGSVVDLTLIEKNGRFVDMGGDFDLFDPISAPANKNVSALQYHNRMILQKAMIQAGFEPFESEWWHFKLKDEAFPDTYFNFDVE